MNKQRISTKNSCACQGVFQKIDTLQSDLEKAALKIDNDGSFTEALREVMAAHFDKATIILRRKFTENQKDVTTGFLLAQCYRLQHRYQDMVDVYEEMARTHTLSHLMVFEMALGYLNLGLIDKALPLLEAVSDEDHYEEPIAYHLAEAYFRTGKLMSSISILRDAIPSHPHSRRLNDFLVRLVEVSDP